MAVSPIERSTSPEVETSETPSSKGLGRAATKEILGTFEQEIVAAKAALAKKFEIHGAKPEDFEAITVNDEVVVVYVGSDGIDPTISAIETSNHPAMKRTWDVIVDEKSTPRYTVDVNGKKYDARDGMTLELQQELINRGVVELNSDGFPRTKVWLTGEAAKDDIYAPVAGQVVENDEGEKVALRSFAHRRDAKSLGMCMRPAIVLGKVSTD